MVEDWVIEECLEPVIADCCIKAVSLDDGDALRAPRKLKSKFGRLRRCDYYLVAKGGDVLVLIEKTDLVGSIEKLRDEFSQILKQTLEFNLPEDYMEADGNTVYREFIQNGLCQEQREKALATLYILEYMRQCKFDTDLRSILKYKRVLYVLLLPHEIDGENAEIISKIGNALEHSLIIKKDFHPIEEKGFCHLMWEMGLHDAEFISSDTK